MAADDYERELEEWIRQRRHKLRPLPRPDPAQRRAVDGWVRLVPGLVALHLALLLTLRARPGHLALWIWYAGPIVLAVVTAGLLVASLRSAHRWKHGVNHWQLLAYAGLIAVVATLPIYDPYPSSYDERPSAVAYRVPIDGPVTVAWGGSTAPVNYHVFLPDQRWAYDLLVTRDGRTFRTDGAAVEDYYAYGLTVYAPAAGRVFAARDGEPDVAIGARRWGLAGLGNHVGIEVGPGEYLFIGHLQPGSVTVGVGDRVAAGQPLGRVGNSGTAASPTCTCTSRIRRIPTSGRASRSTSTATGTTAGSSSAACPRAGGSAAGTTASASSTWGRRIRLSQW